MQAFPQLDPREIYTAAIDAGMAQVQRDPSNLANHDTLAFRLLNCALWHMRAEPARPQEASVMLMEVLKHCGNARTMATVAQHVSKEAVASGGVGSDGVIITPDPNILNAITTLIFAALSIASQSPITYEDADYIADLAVAHCDIGCTVQTAGGVLGQLCQPPNLAMWALSSVPTISKDTRTRLCMHAKAGAYDITGFSGYIDRQGGLDKVDGAGGSIEFGGATAKWREISGGGSGLPKAMMFVLDLSFSMDADSRLPTCKKSLSAILTENVDGADRVGLVTFADNVSVDLRLQVAGVENSASRKAMLKTVNSLRTRGMTAFYSAVHRGAMELAKELSAEPRTPKWLIALTDGADNRSQPGHAAQAVKVISETPNLNVALITVGDGIDMKVCQTFLDAATNAGNISMLVRASNQQEISKAFETVSAAMGAGVAEVL